MVWLMSSMKLLLYPTVSGPLCCQSHTDLCLELKVEFMSNNKLKVGCELKMASQNYCEMKVKSQNFRNLVMKKKDVNNCVDMPKAVL